MLLQNLHINQRVFCSMLHIFPHLLAYVDFAVYWHKLLLVRWTSHSVPGLCFHPKCLSWPSLAAWIPSGYMSHFSGKHPSVRPTFPLLTTIWVPLICTSGKHHGLTFLPWHISYLTIVFCSMHFPQLYFELLRETVSQTLAFLKVSRIAILASKSSGFLKCFSKTIKMAERRNSVIIPKHVRLNLTLRLLLCSMYANHISPNYHGSRGLWQLMALFICNSYNFF